MKLLRRLTTVFPVAALICLTVGGISLLSPPAAASAPGGFRGFDSIGDMPGKPDLSAYGFDTHIVLLTNFATPNPVIFNMDWTVNTASLQSYVNSLPANTIIALDFESGPWHYERSTNQAQTDWTKQKITETISAIRATPGRSDIKVGHYPGLVRQYWVPTQYHLREGWQTCYLSRFHAQLSVLRHGKHVGRSQSM